MKRDCEKCCYFGCTTDVSETVEKDCMYVPEEDNDYEDTLPCEKECGQKSDWRE